SRCSFATVESGCFKIVVPHVDINGIPRRRLLAPQLARGEAHGIEMLGFLAEEKAVRIRKNKHAVIALDGTGFSARLARQAGGAGGIYITGAYALADLETRSCRNVAARWRAAADQRQRRIG